MCHGGTDNQSGAPPSATWGNDGDPVRIGAHTVHGQGSAFAPAFDCDVCHVKPADALSSGHVDGITQVPFHGIATTANQQPRWDHATATCSNIYCHGATLTGGTNTTPVWTGGHGQVACGTCHGVPPPSPHPSQDPNLTTCASCHANTVDATGNLIAIAAGGKHLDGVIEATSSHPPEWTDPTSQWFHAYSANAGIAKCTPCHGPNLDQPNGGCGRCHDTNLPAGIASWKVNCTMCHGGTDNQTGAPPRTTWGKTAEFALVGAHTAHVSGNRISAPFACVQCHVTPADALAPGHVNGDLTITFGGIATQGVVVPPAWNRTTATCSSTYCHGATLVGGTNTQPIWTTVNGTQAACGTCHGIPPPVWGHSYPPAHNMNACTFCHYDVADDRGTTITNPALHVNGVVNVRNRDTDPDCVSCHGIW
jgi:predicted CxxxxCH...CXXCH cytochrome family protein